MNRIVRIITLLLAITAPAAAGTFRPAATNPQSGMGRYRVRIADTAIESVGQTAVSLAATYGARLEPFAEAGFHGFMAMMSPARAKLLSQDAVVADVEEVEAPVVRPASAMAAGVPATPEMRVAAPATTEMATLRSHIAANSITPSWSGSYSYDGSGNIKSITTNVGSDVYRYDGVSRLKGAVVSGHEQTYTYDAFGNLKMTTTGASAQCAGGVSCSQDITVSSATNRVTSNSALYDAAGNLKSFAGYTFTWDDLGMLRRQAGGGIIRQYIYTADDERLAVYSAAQWSWAIRDPGGAILREFTSTDSGNALGSANWQWTEDYVYRGSQLLAAVTPQGRRHFHLDHLGTPRLITDDAGHHLGSHTYLPFGAELASAANELPAETRKFTGHERDGSGDIHTLDYMHARYYGWGMGRFLSVDPELGVTQNPQTFNRYVYGLNNPVKYSDPDGRSATLIGGLLGGAVGGSIALWQGRSWREVGAAAAGGAVTGAMMGSVIDTGGASLGIMIGAGALSGVAGTITENAVLGRRTTAADALYGGLGGAAGEMAGAAVGRIVEAVANRMGGFSRSAIAEMAAKVESVPGHTGNFGLGRGTAREAEAMGVSWVGKGYRLASDGKTLVSADGLRQYRPPTEKPRLGIVQANFEWRTKTKGPWEGNGHLDVTEK